MAVSSINCVLQHVRLLAGAYHQSSATDQQLLQQFHQKKDESAFSALVERHGPLVWQTARRVLQNRHDAEDVFQAAFVILARTLNPLNPVR